MRADEAHAMNGGGSLAHRAWAEAARSHGRLDMFEAVYVEQQKVITRDIASVRSDVEELQKAFNAQATLMRNAIDGVKTDISAKVGALYGRVWWLVGMFVAAQSTAIVWLANKAFQ